MIVKGNSLPAHLPKKSAYDGLIIAGNAKHSPISPDALAQTEKSTGPLD
jgi:hypothetical protein